MFKKIITAVTSEDARNIAICVGGIAVVTAVTTAVQYGVSLAVVKVIDKIVED